MAPYVNDDAHLVGAISEGVQDTSCDKLSGAPAGLVVHGEDASEGERRDLRSVCLGDGVVETPGETAEELADEEHGERGGKEGDEDDRNHEDEGAEHGLLVTKIRLNISACYDSDESTYGRGIVARTLPSGRDLVGTVTDRLAKLHLEGGLGHEVADQRVVVRLHDNHEGHHEGPEGRLGEHLQGLPNAHVLLVLGRDGLSEDRLVGFVGDVFVNMLVVLGEVLLLGLLEVDVGQGHVVGLDSFGCQEQTW